MTSRFGFGILAIVVGFSAAAGMAARTTGASALARKSATAAKRLTITVLSTRPDRVSGGDALVKIAVPAGAPPRPAVVSLNGRDVSGAFHADEAGGSLTALVTGLRVGKNVLRASGRPWGVADATLDLTNYPVSGPIVSGPHLTPFVCQTESFKLPDGSTLGPARDADCTVPTRVQYVYMPAGGTDLKLLPSTTVLPGDVATTTTTSGRRVPFVVRLETGTMNRGIYQNVVLHDPTRDPAPTPFSPPPAWNRRLIAVHGAGCPSGWFRQGGVQGVNILNPARLGEGYAIFTNTLNHPTNSCNPFLAGETAMMGKEHVIETFGVPDFTISMGGSGGAYTSLQVADEFPGLFDALVITATFPDALSIAMAGLDGRLMTHYVAVTSPAALSEAQKIAVTGYSGVKALVDAANQSQRTDPVPGRADNEGYRSAMWHESVPQALRYDPVANPRGARPTIFDAARNVYGVDAKTGFALRPFDNVGVQYGLAALNAGAITIGQFLDLNERVGGYDHDANYTAERSVGDASAIKRLYQSSVTLGGGGGLASIPVFDAGAYNETGGYHYQWFHFAVRERMRKENGNADNHLMWRGIVPAERSWDVIVRWAAAVKADRSPGSDREKAIRNRPVDAVDGCWVKPDDGGAARFVAEPQTFSSRADSTCNRALPSYSFTRGVAGGPLDGNVLKCQLKPIDAADYAVPLSASDLERLRGIFPGGVCDWSRPGVNQVRVVPWASFGPAPEHRLVSPHSPTH